MKTLTATILLLTVLAVNAFPVYAQQIGWSYFTVGAPTSISYTLTDTYLEIDFSASLSTDGFTIGSPYYIFNRTPFNTSPWYIDYEVTEYNSGTCKIRPTVSQTNALTGANTITFNSLVSATTSLLTFTSPSSNNGQIGATFSRDAGTCDVVVRVYEIRASDNTTVLWSPVTDTTETVINFPDNIQFQSDTIIWSMGFMIMLMAINTWFVIIRRR